MSDDGALFDLPSSSSSATPVHDAYAAAIAELERLGALKLEHMGLAANLLRLGTIIDLERKGYAVAHATAQAHAIMSSLLELVPPSTGDAFTDLMQQLAAVAPSTPPPA